jgi:hypothetical protein
MATTVTALVACSVLLLSGIAHADILSDTITGSHDVALVAGSAISGSASITVTGNSSDGDNGCNSDQLEAPLVLDIVTPAGITASPDPLSVTTCDTFPVTFTASSSAQSGIVTVIVVSQPAGGGSYKNDVEIPITVTQPVPTNTKPTVAVTGVTDGSSYQIGTVPSASCAISDVEDGSSTNAAVLSGTLVHGLGQQTATCGYTDNGGLAATTATASYTVVDTGAPTISYTLSSAGPIVNGWYTSAVTVHFDCADLGSGIQSCTGDTTLGDGANQSVTGTATDWAGKSTTVTTASINIDTLDPTITGSPNSAANTHGWYNSDVVVQFVCTDLGSGIQYCTPDATLSDDGAGQSVTGTAIDNAGHSAMDTVSGIDIDKTAPTIGYTLTPSAPNANGWYKTDVAVNIDCADALSGVQACDGDTTLGEGASQTATGTATDFAGNSASTTTSAIKIDETAPIVGFSGGPSGSYYFGSEPAAPTCVASDGLSGLDTCTITGGGTSVGQHSYTAIATDLAGNETTATLTYTVLAWSIKGFYSPVDMGGVWNTVKAGSTVPLKFEIFAGAELTSVSAVSSFTAVPTQCPSGFVSTDAIEFLTTGGTSLRYDSTGGQFIQNWATPKKPGTCLLVTMTAQDGSPIQAKFILK